jgi:LmbE family N-acetylglucosaminyl deacetylase
MSKTRKILSVLAHPDDESFGMGGTLAKYAQQGVEIHLICATRGEAGEVDPHYMDGFESIADRRVSELLCAAEHLGLAKVHFLDYRDSGMEGSEDNQHPEALINAPLEQVAGEVVAYIRDFQPDVVLTFDPVGGYHHPDHIHIQKAATMAFKAAGDEDQYPDQGQAFQPARLYYHIFPRKFIRVLVRILRLVGRDPSRFGRNGDIDLARLAGDEDYPPHVKINYAAVEEKKDKASQCHASQISFSTQNPVIQRLSRLLAARKDTFMQASPVVAESYRAKDLFE